MVFRFIAFAFTVIIPLVSDAAAPSSPVTEKMAHFEVDGLRLTIPDAYRDDLDKAIYKDMTGKVRVLRVRELGGIGLVVVYPTMRSFTPNEFANPSRRLQLIDSIRINIEPTQFDEHFWAGKMSELVENGLCDADTFMDSCPDWSLPKRSAELGDESLYLGTEGDFTYCSTYEVWSNPSCELGYVLVDGISIEIRFNRRFLDDVLGIRQRIFDLVCSWVDLPAGRTYRVNHCR